MADLELVAQLRGYSLTTAEIIYRMPDHPALLQSYFWQEYDLAPRFPELRRFLDFWSKHLDGAVHGVRVASRPLVAAAEFRVVDGQWMLN
jgi:uncharacterized protein Usg